MTDFVKGVYADMRPVDRVLLYMVKVHELFELQSAMGAEDIRLIREIMQRDKEGGGDEHEQKESVEDSP